MIFFVFNKMEIENCPKHVGLILDGNRRFAKKLMLEPWKGHEHGAGKVKKLFDWAKLYGVKELTLYTFSLQNFNRPKKEFDYLMNLFKKEFEDMYDKNKLDELKTRINFLGRINMFPDDVSSIMKKLMVETKNYSDYVVNFAMAYGGRAEIVDATKAIAKQIKEGKINPEDITEEMFAKNLYTDSQPDLIIRTSGERRTSGFMLYQSEYSEFYFLDKFWPDFDENDFKTALIDYSQRQRRFGK